MLILLSLSFAADPPPDASHATVAVQQTALLHLAAAFESGVARCPLPAADLADAELTLAGFPIVRDGDALVVLADQERRHPLTLQPGDRTLWLQWAAVQPGAEGPCTATVGEPPRRSGGVRFGMQALDADGNPEPMSKVEIKSESGFRYGSVKREFDQALADSELPADQRARIEAWRDDWFPSL